ncbi:hypothetical protein DENSPDRAFT_887196, partial [Dentipellis sp. KUC8613]
MGGCSGTSIEARDPGLASFVRLRYPSLAHHSSPSTLTLALGIHVLTLLCATSSPSNAPNVPSRASSPLSCGITPYHALSMASACRTPSPRAARALYAPFAPFAPSTRPSRPPRTHASLPSSRAHRHLRAPTVVFARPPPLSRAHRRSRSSTAALARPLLPSLVHRRLLMPERVLARPLPPFCTPARPSAVLARPPPPPRSPARFTAALGVLSRPPTPSRASDRHHSCPLMSRVALASAVEPYAHTHAPRAALARSILARSLAPHGHPRRALVPIDALPRPGPLSFALSRPTVTLAALSRPPSFTPSRSAFYRARPPSRVALPPLHRRCRVAFAPVLSCRLSPSVPSRAPSRGSCERSRAPPAPSCAHRLTRPGLPLLALSSPASSLSRPTAALVHPRELWCALQSPSPSSRANRHPHKSQTGPRSLALLSSACPLSSPPPPSRSARSSPRCAGIHMSCYLRLVCHRTAPPPPFHSRDRPFCPRTPLLRARAALSRGSLALPHLPRFPTLPLHRRSTHA